MISSFMVRIRAIKGPDETFLDDQSLNQYGWLIVFSLLSKKFLKVGVISNTLFQMITKKDTIPVVRIASYSCV